MKELRNRLYKISISLLLVTTLQLVLGTQVREAIDAVKLSTDLQESWLVRTNRIDFVIHRSFSWLVLFSALWIMSILWKKQVKGILYKIGLYNFILIFISNCYWCRIRASKYGGTATSNTLSRCRANDLCSVLTDSGT